MMGEESEEDCFQDPPSGLNPVKRVRLTQTDLLNLLLNEVTEIRTCMNSRLTVLETKVSALVSTCNKISSRLGTIEQLTTTNTSANQNTNHSSNNNNNENTTANAAITTNTSNTTSSASSSAASASSTALPLPSSSLPSSISSTSSSSSSFTTTGNSTVAPRCLKPGMIIAVEMPGANNNNNSSGGTTRTPLLIQEGDGANGNAQMSVLRLNSEEDFPQGSWLGDPSQPSMRVRCPITPQNLLHINSTCITAEKMALTLLDYLFTKDEIATSNLTGRSRWNKRQLDPMMMFGIRCHLQYKFNIDSKQWHKICQNMGSKCRSAWKRRVRGMVTQPKQRPSGPPQIGHTSSVRKDPAVTEDISFDFDSLQNSNLDLSDVKVITQSPTCELRILSTATDHISQLQDTQEIILSEEQILGPTSSEKSILISNSSPSVSIGSEGLGGELDMSQTPTLASMDHSDHRMALKNESGLAILDQHGILARDSETDD